MADWLFYLRLGNADASQQREAAAEIERLRTSTRSSCPDDCPGKLKFHAEGGKKGRDWR